MKRINHHLDTNFAVCNYTYALDFFILVHTHFTQLELYHKLKFLLLYFHKCLLWLFTVLFLLLNIQ